MFDSSKRIYFTIRTFLYNIALWARTPNLPFAHVPMCMHDLLAIKGRT